MTIGSSPLLIGIAIGPYLLPRPRWPAGARSGPS
jgi:hypothetical protein